MTGERLLADEHVPEPVVVVLESLGCDVVRSKAELPEGTDDRRLLEFARQRDRTVLTADRRFTVVDGDVITDHAGVVYADQGMLQRRPADAAEAIDRILETIPPEERFGSEFYLGHWMTQS